MSPGHKPSGRRLDLEKFMSELTDRMEAMEARMNNRIEAMEARLNNTFEAVDVKIKDLATRVDRLELSRRSPSPARQINNLCHGCGQPGHFVSQCPDSPAKKTVTFEDEKKLVQVGSPAPSTTCTTFKAEKENVQKLTGHPRLKTDGGRAAEKVVDLEIFLSDMSKSE